MELTEAHLTQIYNKIEEILKQILPENLHGLCAPGIGIQILYKEDKVISCNYLLEFPINGNKLNTYLKDIPLSTLILKFELKKDAKPIEIYVSPKNISDLTKMSDIDFSSYPEALFGVSIDDHGTVLDVYYLKGKSHYKLNIKTGEKAKYTRCNVKNLTTKEKKILSNLGSNISDELTITRKDKYNAMYIQLSI